jgi:hypothetical protein
VFAKNPLVTGPPHIRFYIGVPIMYDGLLLGTWVLGSSVVGGARGALLTLVCRCLEEEGGAVRLAKRLFGALETKTRKKCSSMRRRLVVNTRER